MEDLSAQSRLTRTTMPFAIDRAGIVVHDTSPYRHITRPSGVASIEYVVSGQGTVIENNSKFHVKSGDVFILHAGRYQDYFPDDEDPWTRIWVQLSGYIISDILRAYGLSHINHIPKFDIEADLRAIGEIIRLDTDQAVIDTEGPHLLISLLQKLQEELFRRDANRKNTSIARSMHRMIISNPSGSISLDEISQELNFSKRHLIRIFKDVYNITPYEFILNRRIEIAQSLLKHTLLSVEEISEQLQFCEASYFTDFFRNRTGITPTEYRKSFKTN